MKHPRNLASFNDVMHAIVISGALVVTVLGLFDELVGFRGEDVLTVAASAVSGASLAYAASLAAQPAPASVKVTPTSRSAGPATISL